MRRIPTDETENGALQAARGKRILFWVVVLFLAINAVVLCRVFL